MPIAPAPEPVSHAKALYAKAVALGWTAKQIHNATRVQVAVACVRLGM